MYLQIITRKSITIFRNMEEVSLVKVNKSIGCTVNECKFHAKQDSFCSLDHINVVKHVTKATSQEATDCGSFETE